MTYAVCVIWPFSLAPLTGITIAVITAVFMAVVVALVTGRKKE